MERPELFQERQKTHGSFVDNATISQALKSVIATGVNPNNAVFQEALDMICLKISRIASGQANFKDHWDDIAGYAQLASEACDASKRNA